jgi:ligand-binding sensor domain-containing protein
VTVVLAALLCTWPGSWARADWQNFRGARDGLADNQVLSILEDQTGVMWFGTPKGASQFDGVRWKTERDSLPNLAVLSLLQDRTGAIWFGTENGGLARFDGATWTRWSSPGTLPSNQVEAIFEDHAGDIWLGTPGGLVRHRPADGTWTTYDPGNSGLVHQHAWRLAEDLEHNLWIATPEGASRLDRTRTQWESFRATPGALERDSVLALVADRSGRIWFGTDQGVFRLDQGAWTRFTTVHGLGDNVVTVIVEDHSGALWFGGTFGVSRFDGMVWRQTAYTSEGQPLGRILAFQQDASGNLWTATAASGLYRSDGVSWRNYFSTNTLTCPGRTSQNAPFLYVLDSNCLTDMLQDGRGELWFATADGGASRCATTGRWTRARRGPGVPLSDSLNVLFEDRDRRLWFGSAGAGLARLDSARTGWSLFTRASGLAGDTVHTFCQDRRGDLWVGTGTGASRHDGMTWRNALTTGGPPEGIAVHQILEDSQDRLWFRTSDGLYRLDSTRVDWRRFSSADGLADDVPTVLALRRDGRLCVGTARGLSVFDGASWSTERTFGAPADSSVLSILDDSAGRLWVVLRGGAACLMDGDWVYFSQQVLQSRPYPETTEGVFEDGLGTLWVSTFAGLARFNGDVWRVYDSRGDGLASDQVTGFLEDSQGHLWFTSFGGLTEHGPDRVTPQTVLLTAPPSLTPSQDANVVFGAGYGESADIEYSYEWDGSYGSAWSPEVSWSRSGIADGSHRLLVRARDWARNTDPTSALLDFEVDATPPNAVLSAPVFGQPVRDVLEVRGSASDARFRAYRVEARPAGGPDWTLPIDSASTSVESGLLALWDTRGVAEGVHDLRLAVTDTLGLVGIALVTVMVDNLAPFADVTAPASVSSLTGGDVYTTLGELHLYFAPRAFVEDAVVSLVPAAPPTAQDLPPGAQALGPCYDVLWSQPLISKPPVADLAIPEAALAGPPALLALYAQRGGGWVRLGGTIDRGAGRISAALPGAGRFALVAEADEVEEPGAVSELRITPRAFSPAGRFASTTVAISFSLARPSPTTVIVYNRAGRRVRQVADNQPLRAGANVVRWDGCNDEGRMVQDGIYVVTVEALGQVETRTVAVIR